MISVVAAGLPASGKSTFIAALTHLLNAKELPTCLTLAELSGDEKHLHALESEWLGAQRLARTQRTNEHWGRFKVRDTESGEVGELLVPDLRGELFEQPATIGGCQRALWDALLECGALMLFTNADRPDDDHLVDEIASAVAAIEAAAQTGTNASLSGPSTTAFSASAMPEEPKLVELLQAINRWPTPIKKRKLALVVSAWDIVEEASRGNPDAWLASHRPMLHQFLHSNPHLWDVRVYGVSAQGGRLPRDEAALRGFETAGERIAIVGTDVKPHDLTSILYWLMTAT